MATRWQIAYCSPASRAGNITRCLKVLSGRRIFPDLRAGIRTRLLFRVVQQRRSERCCVADGRSASVQCLETRPAEAIRHRFASRLIEERRTLETVQQRRPLLVNDCGISMTTMRRKAAVHIWQHADTHHQEGARAKGSVPPKLSENRIVSHLVHGHKQIGARCCAPMMQKSRMAAVRISSQPTSRSKARPSARRMAAGSTRGCRPSFPLPES